MYQFRNESDPIRTKYFWSIISLMLLVIVSCGAISFIAERAFSQSVLEEEGPFLVREPGDVWEIIENEDQFSTLKHAIEVADIDETLEGEGPYTVFAPTNKAFSKLPKEKLEALLKEKNHDQLVKLLTHHVSPGLYMAADVVNSETIPTLEGQELEVDVKGDEVIVDGARVIGTDMVTGNGVVHAIDTVIFPDQVMLMDVDDDDSQADDDSDDHDDKDDDD